MAAALLVFCGCNNYIRNFEESEIKVERSTVAEKNNVRFTPDPPVNSQFLAIAERLEQEAVKKYQIKTTGEVVTPYSGWRKSYEMPCGLALIPVSIVSHIMSALSFGMYPFSVSGTINDLAFTGINPCLNWESESRIEKITTLSESKLIDEYKEDKATPYPKKKVMVKSGDRARAYVTDEFGAFTVVLVGLDPEESIFNAARDVNFWVGDDKTPSGELLLTREFAGKLLRARALMVEYNLAPSGRKLVDTVKKLEGLKFNELAYEFEKCELGKRKNDEAFMTDFNNASME